MEKIQQTEMTNILQIAKTCHEVNRAYCESLGDNSQLPWEFAPQWQKDSAISGVKFHLEHPHTTPEDSHRNWMHDKAVDGWKYGPEKNVDKKEHPCMVPYYELPYAQRLKDTLFVAIVRSFPRHFEMVIEDEIPLKDKPSV